MKPDVQVIDDVARLRETVAKFWPRWARAFNAAQAGAILKRFRRFPVDDLLTAVADAFEDDPDAKAPSWSNIWELASATLTGRRKVDAIETDAHRHWWRSWFDSRQDREEPERFAWAKEIIRVDDNGSIGNTRYVGAADYKAWHDAVFAYGEWAFYMASSEWWAEGQTTMTLTIGDSPVEVNVGDRGAPPKRERRIAVLTQAHKLVRNLRTFGPATTAWKEAALTALEADARTGQFTIEGVDNLAAMSPF